MKCNTVNSEAASHLCDSVHDEVSVPRQCSRVGVTQTVAAVVNAGPVSAVSCTAL